MYTVEHDFLLYALQVLCYLDTISMPHNPHTVVFLAIWTIKHNRMFCDSGKEKPVFPIALLTYFAP